MEGENFGQRATSARHRWTLFATYLVVDPERTETRSFSDRDRECREQKFYEGNAVSWLDTLVATGGTPVLT